MRTCIMCDKRLTGPGAFRIRIGGVSYDDDGVVHFVQTPEDYFQDHTKTKWLCAECAERNELYIDELGMDACRAPEGGASLCGMQFEPVESPASESVLLIEWGTFESGVVGSRKGPSNQFRCSGMEGLVHFNCAGDAYNIPLHSIPFCDEP